MLLLKLNALLLIVLIAKGSELAIENELSFVAIVQQMSALENSLGKALIYEDAPVDSVLFNRFCTRDFLRDALKGCANFNVSRTDCNQKSPALSSTNYYGAAYSTNGVLELTRITQQKCAFAIFSPGKTIKLNCSKVPTNYLKASSLTPVSPPVTVTANIDVQFTNSLYLDASAAPSTPGPLNCTWTSS